MSDVILDVKNLQVQFRTGKTQTLTAIQDVTFQVKAGEILGIVGESGCGKSVTANTILRLLPKQTSLISGGSICFQGRDLVTLSEKEMRAVRGSKISMIFQEPMTSLNPYMKVGEQLAEVLMLHQGMGKREAWDEAVKMLDAVKIPEAKKRIGMYPHEISGGMRQRVMIAMALLCRPKLLIADEPTTALDVTVQAQIMTLLNELKRDFGTTIIMITHDLGVVAGICDQVLVMYAGRTMEYGKVDDIFYRPTHPYTIGLLGAVPRLDGKQDLLPTIPGNPPNLVRLPAGCPFQERCPHVHSPCRESAPALQANGHKGGLRACFRQQQGDAA